MKHRSTPFYTILAIVAAIVIYTLTHKEASDVPKWMLTDWVWRDTTYNYIAEKEPICTSVCFTGESSLGTFGGLEPQFEYVSMNVYLDPIYDNGDITKGELCR